jgi:hypothetical protein
LFGCLWWHSSGRSAGFRRLRGLRDPDPHGLRQAIFAVLACDRAPEPLTEHRSRRSDASVGGLLLLGMTHSRTSRTPDSLSSTCRTVLSKWPARLGRREHRHPRRAGTAGASRSWVHTPR